MADESDIDRKSLEGQIGRHHEDHENNAEHEQHRKHELSSGLFTQDPCLLFSFLKRFRRLPFKNTGEFPTPFSQILYKQC